MEDLVNLLKEATISAVQEVSAQTDIFALALCSVDDLNFVHVSINSEENHKKILEKKKIASDSPDAEYYRWSPCEWRENEVVGPQHFQAVNRELGKLYDATQNLEEHQSDTMDAMLEALQAVRAALIAQDVTYKDVYFFITLYDSHLTQRIESDSSRLVNPPSLHAAFEQRYSKTEAAALQAEKQKETIFSQLDHLGIAEQADFWCTQLVLAKDGKPNILSSTGLNDDTALTALSALGSPATLTVIEKIQSLLTQQDSATNTLIFQFLKLIKNWETVDPSAHAPLVQILEQACQISEQTRWRTTPFHIAGCLTRHFPGYPSPAMAGNNKLENYREWIALGKKQVKAG